MNKLFLNSNLLPKILMVCTEYPPMQGGIGRYTHSLAIALRKIGYDVQTVSNKMGNGDFSGLSPSHTDDSQILLQLVDKTKPDIVHVQYEQGMYGLVLNGLRPTKTQTNIDSFYDKCKTPIVTTFHSGYTFKQWLKLVQSLKPLKPNFEKGFSSNIVAKYWTSLLNYYSFHNLNKEKLAKSKMGIVFSDYLSKIIGGGKVIFHGAEPNSSSSRGKEVARKMFNLPKGDRIALAVGFMTSTKGWDILEEIDVPTGWSIVTNSSHNDFGQKYSNRTLAKHGIIDLQLNFLSEEYLSILFSSADAVLLPYKVCSGSGVMFDALAHGLPFVATNLGFFKEFANKGLGITVDRNSNSFAKGLEELGMHYDIYKHAVDKFRSNICWTKIAEEHSNAYKEILEREASIIPALANKQRLPHN
ncbi:MAG TPA: glycosyltransferase family 4 protein [Nitrososphaeraceae archaeon]|jgi:glycosyltransferase involved in cell wall biosynthesis